MGLHLCMSTASYPCMSIQTQLPEVSHSWLSCPHWFHNSTLQGNGSKGARLSVLKLTQSIKSCRKRNIASCLPLSPLRTLLSAFPRPPPPSLCRSNDNGGCSLR